MTNFVQVATNEHTHPDRLALILGIKEADIFHLRLELQKARQELASRAAQDAMKIEALESEVARLNNMLDSRTGGPPTPEERVLDAIEEAHNGNHHQGDLRGVGGGVVHGG